MIIGKMVGDDYIIYNGDTCVVYKVNGDKVIERKDVYSSFLKGLRCGYCRSNRIVAVRNYYGKGKDMILCCNCKREF